VAITPAYTRGPAPRPEREPPCRPLRIRRWLGASSEVIVSRLEQIDYVEPYKRVRDTLTF